MMVRALLPALVALGLAACGREEPAPRPETPPLSETARLARDTTLIPMATIGGLQARRTEAGLVADLLSANREEGVLAVTIRFRNAITDTIAFALPSEGGRYPGVRLTAGGQEWPLSHESDVEPGTTSEFDIVVAPGQSRLWRGVFAAPPASIRAFDLEMPGVERFVEVPIRDR